MPPTYAKMQGIALEVARLSCPVTHALAMNLFAARLDALRNGGHLSPAQQRRLYQLANPRVRPPWIGTPPPAVHDDLRTIEPSPSAAHS